MIRHRPWLLSAAVSLGTLTIAPAQDGPPAAGAPPIRVGVRARNGGADRLTPLRYIGGFESKTMVYETLVRRGDDGRIAPGLASAWSIEDEGRTFRFELREGAKFHDGTAVTADAVKVHFQRWVGLPEHDWLLANERITGVTVETQRAFRVHLDQPYALLADLCCINPCAIVGPGARDWEGEFQRPVGTGPFRFEQALDGGQRWRLVRVADGQALEVAFFPRGRDSGPIDALQRGELDAFVGGWDEDLPAERLAELAADPRFRVDRAPGSSVTYLSFRLQGGPTNDLATRQRIAAAIDRDALIAEVEGGAADPCTTWAAPSCAFWPKGPGIAPVQLAAAGAAPVPLKVAAGRGEGRAARVAAAVVRQLQRAGFAAELVASPRRRAGDAADAAAPGAQRDPGTPENAESAEVRAAARRELVAQAEQADVRVEITHGMPYCPHQSLVARFGLPRREGEPEVRAGNTRELMQLVAAAAATPDEARCLPLYAQIQALMDRQALIVPLYAPRRVALRVAGVDGIGLGPDVYSVDLTGLRRVEAR